MRPTKKPVKSFFERFDYRKEEPYDILEKELTDAIGESSRRLKEYGFPKAAEGKPSEPVTATKKPQYDETKDLISQLSGVKKEPSEQVLPTQPSDSVVQTAQEPIREPSSMQTSDVDALLVGATPLLAGLLTGNMGDAYEASSSGLMTLAKWRREKEKQDRTLASKMSKSSGKGFYVTQVEMPDGTIKLAKVDKETGQIIPTEYTAGYKQSFLKLPQTEEYVAASGAKGEISPLKDKVGVKPQELNVREQRLLRNTRDKLEGTQEFKTAKTAFNSANQIITTLQSGNPIGEVGTKILFPRMFGEVGNLTAQEQAAFQSNPELFERGKQAYSRYLQGKPFTDQNKSDLIELARLMRDANKKVINNIVTSFAEQEGALSGVEPSRAKEILMKRALPNLNTTGIVKGLKGKKEAGQIIYARNKKTGKVEKLRKEVDGTVTPLKD